MRLFYTDHYELPLPPGHKFPIRKYRMLREALQATGLFELLPAPLATPEEIEAAHDPAYIWAFIRGTLSPQAVRRIGFPWSNELVLRTLASVGSTLAVSREALAHGVSGSLAGGTHHAFFAEGSGFCVFNDIAVAVRILGLRAAVIDLDVHQGDGTAAIFEGAENVLTFSMHGANNFPFRKQRSRIDVELADGAADDEYLARLQSVLPSIWSFAPRIVFFQAGVDALSTDKLGRLALSPAGMQQRDSLVVEASRRAGIPLAIVLGGGYSDPIEATVEAHANTFLTAHNAYRM